MTTPKRDQNPRIEPEFIRLAHWNKSAAIFLAAVKMRTERIVRFNAVGQSVHADSLVPGLAGSFFEMKRVSLAGETVPTDQNDPTEAAPQQQTCSGAGRRCVESWGDLAENQPHTIVTKMCPPTKREASCGDFPIFHAAIGSHTFGESGGSDRSGFHFRQRSSIPPAPQPYKSDGYSSVRFPASA